MNFDSKNTEDYLYQKLKPYGNIHITPNKNMIWTIEKVDNFVNDLKRLYKSEGKNLTQ